LPETDVSSANRQLSQNRLPINASSTHLPPKWIVHTRSG
jgi:hypothetical protein